MSQNEVRATELNSGIVRVLNIFNGEVKHLSPKAASVLNPDLAGATPLDARTQTFIQQAKRAGWLDANGKLNGTYRKVPSEQPHLKRLQIELSVKCNFSCTYCYSESGPTQTASLTSDQVMDVIHKADSMGVENIDFTGGEVMIYRGWEELVEEARTCGMSVSVHTNGSLLTERNVSFLKEIGVRCIQVTVESHHAEVHEAVGRGPRGSHARVIKGIERASAAGITTRLAALVHRKNIDHIHETAEWFYKRFQTPMSLDRVMATGVEGAEPLAVSEQEFWEAVSPLLGTGVASASRVCDPVETPVEHVEPECGVAHSYVYLTADGHFSLCPTMTHREEDQFEGPRVTEMTLSEAWHESDLFTRYRGLNCENTSVCPASGACGGGCRSNAYLQTGRLTAPDVISCNTFKNPNRTFVDFLGRYKDGAFTPVEMSPTASV